MMFQLVAVKHSEVTEKLLHEIIRIKSVAWPYSLQQQLEWIEEHINPEDIHLILTNGYENIAYLNLTSLEFIINGTKNRGYGIGNVCATLKGLGYGKELMKQTNQFLISNDSIGLLLCKDQLVDFYKRMGWILLDRQTILLTFDYFEIETMVYNSPQKVDSFIYTGKPF